MTVMVPDRSRGPPGTSISRQRPTVGDDRYQETDRCATARRTRPRRDGARQPGPRRDQRRPPAPAGARRSPGRPVGGGRRGPHRRPGRAARLTPCSSRCSTGSDRWSESCPRIARAHSASTTPTSTTAGCRSTRSVRCGARPRSRRRPPHHLGTSGAAAAYRLSAATLALLAERGHRLAYDGRGLVRADRTGPLIVDRHYPPELLGHLSILKLAEDEAVIVADGEFTASTAARLGVRRSWSRTARKAVTSTPRAPSRGAGGLAGGGRADHRRGRHVHHGLRREPGDGHRARAVSRTRQRTGRPRTRSAAGGPTDPV